MQKNDLYAYKVVWSPEDSEFVGLCSEFPSLSHLAGTQLEALKGIMDLVADVVADMELRSEAVPEPIATQTYNGKVLVRMPPQMHRRLALEAAEAHVSVNRFACMKLGQ